MEAHCETLGVYAPARQHGLKFELATKHRCRKLDEAKTVLLAHDRYPKDLAATELPVTSRHAIVVGQLEWGSRRYCLTAAPLPPTRAGSGGGNASPRYAGLAFNDPMVARKILNFVL